MFSLKGKTVLITGASAGIGAALARLYGKRQANLILIARHPQGLENLAGECSGKVQVFAADVSRDGDLETVVPLALKSVPSLDIVIANAGFGVVGRFETLSLDDYRRQFETNIFGVLRTLQATLEPLKKSRGAFAVVGSVLGHLSIPGNSPYCMSKHAVRALADSLYHELYRYGISVTHISPGVIATRFRQVNNAGEFLHNAKDPIPAWVAASPKRAAKTICRAVRWKKREASITAHGWFLIRMFRYFPNITHHLIRSLRLSSRPAAS